MTLTFLLSVCTQRRLGTELAAWRGGRGNPSQPVGEITLWQGQCRCAWNVTQVCVGILRRKFWNSCLGSSRMVPSASPLLEWNTSIPPLFFHNAKQLTIFAAVCFPPPLPDTCQFYCWWNPGGACFCSAAWKWCQLFCCFFSEWRRLQSSWQFLHRKMPTHHII